MKLLGLSPADVFSGFETSFFDAVEARGPSITRVSVEAPWFKLLSTIASVHPRRSTWGNKRDRLYHTSISAFRVKSAEARRIVERSSASVDAVYQVGALWNPLPRAAQVPLVLHVDYTSCLSRRRGSGWKRRPGREQDFWIEEERRLYRESAIILTTTENARQSVIADYGISPRHVVTVGAGVSAPYDRLQPDRLPAYDSKRIFFLGKGFHGKGLDTVLEAFGKVRARIRRARLTIVGPKALPGRHAGVDYLGRISDRNRVRELYYDHALFVMPSRYEPLGQVFLEAMSCQLPCIGTTLDAMPELIDHGRTGYLIEPGDADALAGHMIDVLRSPDLARQMGAAAFRKLTSAYTWPVVGRRIVTAIERCLCQTQQERDDIRSRHTRPVPECYGVRHA
jgi:glycosyltransferase involved in cell wall biosynthesis